MRVHQLWLGNRPIPAHCRRWMEQWRALAGNDYRLWTDADFAPGELPDDTIGVRADIARLVLLDRVGGLYLDVDIEPLGDPRPHLEIPPHARFLAAWESYRNHAGRQRINNGLIHAYPGDPRLRWMLSAYPDKLASVPPGTPGRPILTTGPELLRDAYDRYPHGVHLLRSDMVNRPTRHAESIVLHHFAGTWAVALH